MRIDKFTQKMQEAVQSSQDVASEFNQQEITNEHFLLALLDQADGITRPLLEKMGPPAEALRERLRTALQKLPRITGGSIEHRLGNDLRSVLDGAEKEMAKLKDEFVSAEHYLLALTNAKVPAARALQEMGVTRDKLMQALQQVRGSQRVTDSKSRGQISDAGKVRTRPDRRWRAGERSTRSLGGTTKSVASCRCCRGARKTIRC